MQASRKHGLRRGRYPIAVAHALMLMILPGADATTIEPMTLATAADHAAQVIDARVFAITPRWVENPRRIETVVTLIEVEYLKGAGLGGVAGSTFELVVPGGTIGSIQMRLAGAPEFHPGDRWILFLLPTYKTHPVVGLTTGAFRVEEPTGEAPKVRDASGRSVGAVRRDGTVEVMGEPRVAPEQRLVGADRVNLRYGPQKASRAMTRDEFVNALRPILTSSRPHAIPHAAGRPAPPVLTPTPLQASERQRREHPSRSAKSGRSDSGTPSAPDSTSRRREP